MIWENVEVSWGFLEKRLLKTINVRGLEIFGLSFWKRPVVTPKNSKKFVIFFTLWAPLSATTQKVEKAGVEDPPLEEYRILGVGPPQAD